MKEFMLLFRFESSNDYQSSEEESEAQKNQWGAFIGNIALQEKLVSTHQLGFNGQQVASDQSTTNGIHQANGETLGGNMIVKAHSMEEAVEMAKGCPILLMGGTVEVRDIIPM